jgi:hypothetical protein
MGSHFHVPAPEVLSLRAMPDLPKRLCSTSEAPEVLLTELHVFGIREFAEREEAGVHEEVHGGAACARATHGKETEAEKIDTRESVDAVFGE